ncbi:MAG: hypothetical protein HYU69_03860 [Bacteroidetes bacterium]|nr:hypothetical protein [Bacteroidota bacterium]
MSKSNHLFELINSLDKQEKRYFQLFAGKNSTGGRDNYIKLFNAIRKQKAYNEDKLKQQFKNTPLYSGFAVTKHNLYELILKALDIYHAEGSTENIINRKIHQIGILFDKKLYNQGLRLTRKTAIIAQAHHRQKQLMELIDWEMKILHAQTEIKLLNEKIIVSHKQKLRLLKEEEQLHLLTKWNYENFVTLKTKWVQTKNKRISSGLLHLHERELLSLPARISYYNTLSGYLFSINDTKGAYNALAKFSALIEENPSIKNDYLAQYVAALNNMNLLLFNSADYNQILANVQKLREIKTKSAANNQHILERIINTEMSVYNVRGDLSAAGNTILQAKEMLRSKKVSDVYKLLFLIHFFSFHFTRKEFREALNYLNSILNETNIDLRQDIQKTARILNLILHYEMQHYDYLPSLVQSAQRFFRKIDQHDDFENTFLIFFKNPENILKRPGHMEHLLKALRKMSKDRLLSKTYFNNFNFLAWAEAKYFNKSFGETIKGNSNMRTLPADPE